MKLATAYLSCYPSDSYTLRDLGNRLEQFLREEPHWRVPREDLVLDMVRFEWAQIVAFDGRSKPPISPADILDTPPSRLRLGLQPYLSLLDPDYAVDDFLIAVKKRESDVRLEALRGRRDCGSVRSLRSHCGQSRISRINLSVFLHWAAKDQILEFLISA
jgi:hypothetical protein